MLFIGVLPLISNNFSIWSQQNINDLQKLIEKYRDEGDKTQEAQYLSKLGYFYWEQEQNNKSIENFKLAIELNK